MVPKASISHKFVPVSPTDLLHTLTHIHTLTQTHAVTLTQTQTHTEKETHSHISTHPHRHTHIHTATLTHTDKQRGKRSTGLVTHNVIGVKTVFNRLLIASVAAHLHRTYNK